LVPQREGTLVKGLSKQAWDTLPTWRFPQRFNSLVVDLLDLEPEIFEEDVPNVRDIIHSALKV
jgi:hypothetical protein